MIPVWKSFLEPRVEVSRGCLLPPDTPVSSFPWLWCKPLLVSHCSWFADTLKRSPDLSQGFELSLIYPGRKEDNSNR